MTPLQLLVISGFLALLGGITYLLWYELSIGPGHRFFGSYGLTRLNLRLVTVLEWAFAVAILILLVLRYITG